MKKIQSNILVKTNHILGEGAMWNHARNTLMWVDIEGMKIGEYNFRTHQPQYWEIGKRVSLILENNAKEIVKIAIQGGIADFNLITNLLSIQTEIEPHNNEIRTNDGSVDPNGNIWIGTMRLDCAKDGGTLYRINKNYSLQKMISPTSISNGMVWSIDKKRLYYIDSPTYKVESYLYDQSTGEIKYEKTAIEIPQSLGMPDGMCQDQYGNLWIAIWGGATVLNYNPITQELIQQIEVAAPHVTSCAFSPDYETIYITTARVGMTETQLQQYPESGSIFYAKV